MPQQPQAGSSGWFGNSDWSGWLKGSAGCNSAGQPVSRGYLIYLLVFGTFGWMMAAYDFNLQVMTLPKISKALGLNPTETGLFGLFVDFGELVCTISFGFYMDAVSRRNAWIMALAGTTVFTGCTYFVSNFWELSVIRALASGLAYTELSISITLVNESLPTERRGLFYGIVQSGWASGVMLAAVMYESTIQWGWHLMFVYGVAPFAVVVIGRAWIREPERFKRIKEIRHWFQCDHEDRAMELSKKYDIPPKQARTHSVRELFQGEQRRQTWVLLSSFFFWGSASMATNMYIVYWMTHYVGYTNAGAVFLMLACGGVGIGGYILCGWIGGIYGRRKVLLIDALLMPAFAVGFMLCHAKFGAGVMYFLLWMVMNAFWSGSAFTYAAESFPTRLRGLGVSLADAAQVVGYVFGASAWTGLINHFPPEAVWSIVAVAFSFGAWIIYFGKNYDPRESLT